jgi:hypothetical protein
MIRSAPLLFLFVFSSCFLFKDLKADRFTYNADGQAYSIKTRVPRGFDREKLERDSAGNTVKFYYYSNGTVFYSAYMADTSKQLQYIDYTRHIPLPHKDGGWIYKGMDSTERYWREIRLANYKFGYVNVPRSLEWDYDEALNYNSLQVFRSLPLQGNRE